MWLGKYTQYITWCLSLSPHLPDTANTTRRYLTQLSAHNWNDILYLSSWWVQICSIISKTPANRKTRYPFGAKTSGKWALTSPWQGVYTSIGVMLDVLSRITRSISSTCPFSHQIVWLNVGAWLSVTPQKALMSWAITRKCVHKLMYDSQRQIIARRVTQVVCDNDVRRRSLRLLLLRMRVYVTAGSTEVCDSASYK